MKYIIYTLSLVIIGLLYVLNADSPVIIMQTGQSGYENIHTWAGTQTPIPLPLTITDKAGGSIRISKYFSTQSDLGYGSAVLHNNELAVSWYDHKNRLQGRFTEQWPADMPLPQYFIHRNLQQLIGVDMTNRVRIIDADGVIDYEMRLFSDKPYNIENNTYCHYSEQLNQLLIGFREVYPVSEFEQGYNSYLMLIDPEGNQKFSISFGGWQINGLAAAGNGEYFMIPLHRYDLQNNQFTFRTILLDKTGALISDLPFQHNKAIFNTDAGMVVFFKNEQAWLYDISQKKIIQNYTVSDQNNIFMNAIFLDEKNLFILQEGQVYKEELNWAFQNLVLQIIAIKGSVERIHPLGEIKQISPVLRYDDAKDQLLIGHKNGYQFYTVSN